MSTTIGDRSEAVFLRPEVKIEPLAQYWYAWPHLIAPLQHAMNVTFRHLPLLQSFVSTPSVHLAATRDPSLFGGPFVNLTQNDVPRIKQLLDETKTSCSRLIKLAGDFKQLEKSVQGSANGFSLQEFYDQVPDSLKGAVELVYDTNHHPKVRILEDLLYDEDISSHTQQVCLSLTGERERHFFMSTPRLESRDSLTLNIRFSDQRLDTLSSMRSRPCSLGEVARSLDLTSRDMEVFNRFFTSAHENRSKRSYDGEDVRVRYFGHACVLIQTARTSVLVDPVFAIERRDDGRLTFDDLPDFIDYVVLTHGHQDHCSPEYLIQLRHRIGKVIVPDSNKGSITDPSIKLILRQLGYTDIDVVDPFDAVSIPDGEIISLPFSGEHADLEICSKQAVFVTVKGRGLMFLADSDGGDPALYARTLRKIAHRVDALFLGMECHGAPLTWLYGPLFTRPINRRDDESRRLSGANCERAWSLVQQIKPCRTFVYAMGQEPWLKYLMGLEYTPDSMQLKEAASFLDRCAQAGLMTERLNISREMTF